MKPVAERGYLITAIQNPDIDYLSCARALAKSIKYWQPESEVCLLTDYPDVNVSELFDYVTEFRYPLNHENPFANDWQIFFCSPFHETIKIESDMMLTGKIDHWWDMLRLRDVVIPQGCRNFYGKWSDERFYRRLFDYNKLPDVYNAITYWRFSRFSKAFFDEVRRIFENWEIYRQLLSGIDKKLLPDTDLVYAIAAIMVGVENVTIPSSEYPSFVHMKGKHNGVNGEKWTKHLVWELDEGNLRINTIAQQFPVHYHEKTFSYKIEEHYDKLLARS